MFQECSRQTARSCRARCAIISLSAVTIRSPTADSTRPDTHQATPRTSSVPTGFAGGEHNQYCSLINPVTQIRKYLILTVWEMYPVI
jgi:hypothetical protein